MKFTGLLVRPFPLVTVTGYMPAGNDGKGKMIWVEPPYAALKLPTGDPLIFTTFPVGVKLVPMIEAFVPAIKEVLVSIGPLVMVGDRVEELPDMVTVT